MKLRPVLPLFALVSLAGCGGGARTTVVGRFRPDPPAGIALVEGRDCSFHLAGMRWRDLSVREAARHALDGTGATELADMSYEVVPSAPFEVCMVVEGTPVVAMSDAHALATPELTRD
jgi:hypothetical protein